MLSFQDLIKKQNITPPEALLALDPGETTGYAIFYDGNLAHSGQLNTKPPVSRGIDEIQNLLSLYTIIDVVMEDYRIYSWKAKDHTWSQVFTIKLIGGIEALFHLNQMKPPTLRLAHSVKTFMTDKKLKEWNLWIKGEPHARDAIRHGCYHILFDK